MEQVAQLLGHLLLASKTCKRSKWSLRDLQQVQQVQQVEQVWGMNPSFLVMVGFESPLLDGGGI